MEASEPLNIDVNYPNDQAQSGYRANLEHAYSMYRSNPAALRDIVNEWVAFVMRPRGATERADGVISVLVARAAMERFAMESAQARARSGMPASPLLWRPFAGDLAEALAFYDGQGVGLTVESSITALGLTAEQAWSAAPSNLRSHLGQLSVSGVPNADRLIFVGGESGLAPSTLIGGAVCGAQARFAFLVVDDSGYVAGDRDDPVAMAQFRQLLESARHSGRSLSVTPLGCHEGRVVEIDLVD